jgi:hypothetical protein
LFVPLPNRQLSHLVFIHPNFVGMASRKRKEEAKSTTEKEEEAKHTNVTTATSMCSIQKNTHGYEIGSIV